MSNELIKMNKINSRDILAGLIADKRSETTKLEYQKDLKDFFFTITGQPINENAVNSFLSMDRGQAVKTVLLYKANLLERKLSEATVNRRLSSIRSLVSYARKIGVCDWNLNDISGEKVINYRDTSGISPEQMKKVLSSIGRSSIRDKRDYCLMLLLWENGLRRGEVSKLNIGDFDQSGTLIILGKGRGTQKEVIDLSIKTVEAINAWLNTRKDLNLDSPLFISLDNSSRGHRLTGTALYKIVREITEKAGIPKLVSPHRIRHSSITAALEATNGNVVLVKQLSRHSRIETLMIYNDRREKQQRKVTELLSAMI